MLGGVLGSVSGGVLRGAATAGTSGFDEALTGAGVTESASGQRFCATCSVSGITGSFTGVADEPVVLITGFRIDSSESRKIPSGKWVFSSIRHS
jgi:hypothetical protein